MRRGGKGRALQTHLPGRAGGSAARSGAGIGLQERGWQVRDESPTSGNGERGPGGGRAPPSPLCRRRRRLRGGIAPGREFRTGSGVVMVGNVCPSYPLQEWPPARYFSQSNFRPAKREAPTWERGCSGREPAHTSPLFLSLFLSLPLPFPLPRSWSWLAQPA